ncbi:MAG: hypothetical protein MJ146_01225 [Clostridia bacterium]|nr:hypothetical protein [Clostridia bacterium]
MNVNELERQQKILSVVRFLAFPLGWIMYIATEKPFGETVAIILSVVAAVGFWLIVMRGRDRSFYDVLAENISKSVKEVGEIDHSVEMRPLAGGLVLRIYLVNPGDRIEIYNKAIYRTLSQLNITSRSWIVQIAAVPSQSHIEDARMTLDEELLKEMEKNRQ